ncbi:MAG: hypothetical protein ACFFD2_03665 [Promethearchaeota archaeon]
MCPRAKGRDQPSTSRLWRAGRSGRRSGDLSHLRAGSQRASERRRECGGGNGETHSLAPPTPP